MANLFLDSIRFAELKDVLIDDNEKYITAKINNVKIHSPTLKAKTDSGDEDPYIILSFRNALLALDGLFLDCITKKD